MRRLAELQHFTIDSSNDVQIPNGESHCWNTLSIQDSCLESKSGDTMDPRRLVNRSKHRTAKRAIYSSEKSDGQDERKENGVEKRRKRHCHESLDYEPPGKMRKSIAPSLSPITIPSSHVLRKGSAGTFPCNSTCTFETMSKKKLSSALTNNLVPRLNESINKIGSKSLKVKTTQELIADLVAKQKSSLSVSLNEKGIVSVKPSTDPGCKIPVEEPAAIEQKYCRNNDKFTASFKRSRSSQNENITFKLSKVKTTTRPSAQELFNDGITCSSSPKHYVNDTRCLVNEPSNSGIRKPEVLEEKISSKLQIRNKKFGMAQLDVKPHKTVSKSSVITTDIPPADIVDAENSDCITIDCQMPPSIDSPPEESTRVQQPSTSTSPTENHDDPQRQNGIHGNYVNGVWYPWQECYDVDLTPEVKLRVLPYVMLF